MMSQAESYFSFRNFRKDRCSTAFLYNLHSKKEGKVTVVIGVENTDRLSSNMQIYKGETLCNTFIFKPHII